MTQLSRRSLITGLISLVAAPAIVRAGSLMPVKQMQPTGGIVDGRFMILCPQQYQALLDARFHDAYEMMAHHIRKNIDQQLYRDVGKNPLLGTAFE